MKRLTIFCKNNKYYVLFACKIEPKPLPTTAKKVGVKLGLVSWCATSDGEIYPRQSLEQFKKEEKELIKTQKRWLRKQKDSQNWEECRIIYENKWEKITNRRTHEIYQVVNDLVKKYDGIAHDKFKVTELIKNKPWFSKNIMNAGWWTFTKILADKAREAGREITTVSRNGISQECSNCGALRKVNYAPHKKYRTFNCSDCNSQIDWDINSARNILLRAKWQGTSLWGAISTEMAKNQEVFNKQFTSGFDVNNHWKNKWENKYEWN